jgi:hypothetical protein
MKCSDRNQLENISSFIDFVALLIELHIWRNDIKYSSFQDASIDIKISPFEWSLKLHIKCAFYFGRFFKLSDRLQFNIPNCRKGCEKNIFYYTCIRIAVLSTPERAKTGDSSTPSFKGCLGNNKFTYILNNDK